MPTPTATACDLCRGLADVLGRPDCERVRIDGRKTSGGQQVWTIDVITDLAAGHASGELRSSLCEAVRQVKQL